MTGRLRTLTQAKKFWPKRAKAVAEGAVAIADEYGKLGDLRIDDPLEGAEIDPLYPVQGSGARPGGVVELWRINRDTEQLVHFADSTADGSGDFAFSGDTPFPDGEVTIYAMSGIEQSPPVTFTVTPVEDEEPQDAA